MQRIHRMKGVLDHTGLSRSTIYALMKLGKFPKPIPLGGPRAVGWRESDLLAWEQQQVEAAAAHDSRVEVAAAA